MQFISHCELRLAEGQTLCNALWYVCNMYGLFDNSLFQNNETKTLCVEVLAHVKNPQVVEVYREPSTMVSLIALM